MGVTERVTRRFVGSYEKGTASSAARRRRWEEFARTFPDIEKMHVVDVGGVGKAWLLDAPRPAQLTLVNIRPQPEEEPWMTSITGDACELPDIEADLLFSNSVIEHVGGHWRRERFAEGIRAVAPRYWVQTPYRYFPIEPHFLFPGFQHFPKAAQAFVAEKWPVGNYSMVKDRREALPKVMRVELLSATEMGHYFPDAEIRRERLAGLTKSLIAVRV